MQRDQHYKNYIFSSEERERGLQENNVIAKEESDFVIR